MSKTCEQCQIRHIRDEANYCPRCGKPVEATIEGEGMTTICFFCVIACAIILLIALFG